MRRGQKYVVRCHKGVARDKVGLGDGRYRKGDLVTYEGGPTRKLDRAFVYTAGRTDFPWEDGFDWGELGDYFEPVPVKVVQSIALDE